MASYLPIILLGVGVLGRVGASAHFVRVTISNNFGSNPGFGAFESSCLPWWAACSIAVGMLTSWPIGVAMLVIGLFGLGFVAQLLGRLFGGARRSAGPPSDTDGSGRRPLP